MSRISNDEFADLLNRIMGGTATDVTPDLIRQCRSRCSSDIRVNELMAQIGARVTEDEENDVELYKRFISFLGGAGAGSIQGEERDTKRAQQ